MGQANLIRTEDASVMPDIDRHLDKILVLQAVPTSTMVFTLLADADTVIVDDTMMPNTRVGFGPLITAIPHNSLAVATLPAGLGITVWHDARESDPYGAIFNAVEIQTASGNPVEINGEIVFGLMQVVDGTMTGDLVAGPGTPNTRIAFYTGDFQQVQVVPGSYRFMTPQHWVDRLVPERVVLRASGGGAVATPTFESASLYSIQRAIVVSGTEIDAVNLDYPNNHLFATHRAVVTGAFDTIVDEVDYPINHLFSTQRAVVFAGDQTDAGTDVPLTIEQLIVTNGQPGDLSQDAVSIDRVTVNNMEYSDGVVAPGNAGTFWAFAAPRGITWNPSNDPNVLHLTPFDSVVVRYQTN